MNIEEKVLDVIKGMQGIGGVPINDEYLDELELRLSGLRSVKPASIYDVSVSLLIEAMEIIDDYLNAGCKETRKEASKKAKILYKKYNGKEYLNRNER